MREPFPEAFSISLFLAGYAVAWVVFIQPELLWWLWQWMTTGFDSEGDECD